MKKNTLSRSEPIAHLDMALNWRHSHHLQSKDYFSVGKKWQLVGWSRYTIQPLSIENLGPKSLGLAQMRATDKQPLLKLRLLWLFKTCPFPPDGLVPAQSCRIPPWPAEKADEKFHSADEKDSDT